jgi:hypothetical protein
MKHTKSIVAIYLLFSFASYGQSSLSISAPTIWSSVKVKDNWTPPTAPNYKEYREGSAFGYGVTLSYSFQPGFIIKNKHFSLNVAAGYFKQRFNITRPFDYSSPVEPIFRTDYYSYYCWQASIGLSYTYAFNSKYFLLANLSFSTLQSFKQEYTPINGFSTQENRNQVDFGKLLPLSLGLNRYFGDQFSLGLHIVVPVYTRWRNDRIFRDDPSTFSGPDFSLGTSINIAYNFGEKR